MIKVGFLLAYDYEFVKDSLPCIYEDADRIVFSLDKRRLSWAGNPFGFDEGILDWIKQYDTKGKVSFYEDDFYVPGNTNMENETRQRNMMAAFMGPGGWHIQLDVDEYFINFRGFVQYLHRHKHYLQQPEQNKISISVDWFNLFKQDETGFFYIKGSYTPVRIATNYPEYTKARTTEQRQLFTPFVMVHQSWARSDEEIFFKMNNWGHKDDIDPIAYYEQWKNVNKDNYHLVKDFAPGKPHSIWKSLGFVPYTTAGALIRNFEKTGYRTPRLKMLKKNAVQLLLKNSYFRKIYTRKFHKL